MNDLRSNSLKFNQCGFSLVELMVVVAIISILATVSVVAFEEAKYKVYAAHAKMTLGTIHTAEQAFFEEYRGYSARLDQIGFNMNGTMYFSVGFQQDTDAGTIYNGTPPPGSYDCTNTCYSESGRGLPSPTCRITMNFRCHNTGCGWGDRIVVSFAGQNAFLAEAHGHYGQKDCSTDEYSPRADTFTINQNKQLIKHDADGGSP